MAPTDPLAPPVPPPDVPGRGAWRLLGGLLPVRPGSTSRVGYYRLPIGGELAPGSAWARTVNPVHTYSTLAVNLGVRAIQHLAGLSGPAVDGWFGAVTDAAVRALQSNLHVAVDGIVGSATMRGALTPLIAEFAADNRIPATVLGGLALLESALDPAAVGTNGTDSGLVQINRGPGAHPEIPPGDAMNPWYALPWAAQQIRSVYDTWSGRTTADPLDIAVAAHNSPQLATQWARVGVPPVVPGRAIQIEDYVVRVRTAWDAA